MKAVAWLRSLLRAIWRRSHTESELDEELRAHVERRADDLMRRGWAKEAAMRKTRIEFGVVAGLAMAAAFTPLISGLLFGVRPSDPLTYVAIAVVVGVVGIAACLLPAWRAMKVDPMIALRHE